MEEILSNQWSKYSDDLRHSYKTFPSCISILIQEVCCCSLCVCTELVRFSHYRANTSLITQQLLSEILCDLTCSFYLYLR